MFDVLPLHIRDWVDSRDVVTTVSHFLNTDNAIVSFVMILDKTKTFIQPEGMLNLNCGMIMLHASSLLGYRLKCAFCAVSPWVLLWPLCQCA